MLGKALGPAASMPVHNPLDLGKPRPARFSVLEISLTRTFTHELHLPFPTSIKSTAPWAAAGLDAGQGVSDLLGPGFEEVVASIGSGHCLFWPSWLASAPKPVYFHRSGSMPHTSSDPEARPIQKTRDATAMQIV